MRNIVIYRSSICVTKELGECLIEMCEFCPLMINAEFENREMN